MANKLRTIVLIVIGVIAIGLSIKCFTFDDLDYEPRRMYGGDAFTGIQNAGAITSKNVKELASIVQFGFGSILLVTGLGFLGVGLTSPLKNDEKQEEKPIQVITAAPKPEEKASQVEEQNPQPEEA